MTSGRVIDVLVSFLSLLSSALIVDLLRWGYTSGEVCIPWMPCVCFGTKDNTNNPVCSPVGKPTKLGTNILSTIGNKEEELRRVVRRRICSRLVLNFLTLFLAN